ncbi:hypothetical protein [Streptomyces chumphonensis]|uniref:hypothetical protein n=1 Tax=Streptomyces chumphonensis TaxID=1214925 RepID=UPI003D759A9B
MLWRRLGLAIGAGAALPALLIVWHWPGQDEPPSIGPAVVLVPPFPQTPPVASAPGPVEPPPTTPHPSCACPWCDGRAVAGLPPPEVDDDDFWDDLTDWEEWDASDCPWEDDEWDD